MKITASHQTVLLARDRAGADVHSGDAGSIALDAGNAVLERLTIVSARPDGVVYVRADYGPSAPADDRVVATVPARAVGTPAVGVAGNPRGAPRGGISSYLKPAEQYALTQRLTDDRRPTSRIDLHA